MSGIWQEIGDRVWVRRYEPLDQAIGVIGGSLGLVVVDTRASHAPAGPFGGSLSKRTRYTE